MSKVDSKDDLKPQTVVKNTEIEDIGVVVPNPPSYVYMGIPGLNEIDVVYDDSIVAIRTDWKKLEIIGPENAIADYKKCGAGKGRRSVVFFWCLICRENFNVNALAS